MSENKATTQAEELISLPVFNSLDIRFASGPIMGRWFQGLKEKKFLASKCPVCGRTQTPPSESCPMCVVRIKDTDLVEVGPKGKVAVVDVFYFSSPDPLTGKLRPVPYANVVLWLDNASPDDAFAFSVKSEDIPRLKRGVRLRPVWNEVRTGSVTDLITFEIDE